jgi:hypothetical protein
VDLSSDPTKIPRFSATELCARYKKCSPSGRKQGQRWEMSPREALEALYALKMKAAEPKKA